MCTKACVWGRRPVARESGISLIELIIFIIIVSVAIAGVLSVMNVTTQHSADPMIQKQAVSIAEAMLEEVELKAFANPSGGFTGAATQANRPLFDDVADYNGFATTGVFPADGSGVGIAGLGGYNVAVTVTATSVGAPASAALRITVTVTDPSGGTTTLTGYRILPP